MMNLKWHTECFVITWEIYSRIYTYIEYERKELYTNHDIADGAELFGLIGHWRRRIIVVIGRVTQDAHLKGLLFDLRDVLAFALFGLVQLNKAI